MKLLGQVDNLMFIEFRTRIFGERKKNFSRKQKRRKLKEKNKEREKQKPPMFPRVATF